MQHCSKQNVTAKPLHIFCSTAANIYAVPLQHIYSGTAKKLAVAGGINPEIAKSIAKYKPGIVIVGNAVNKAKDKKQLILDIRESLRVI